MPVQGEHLHPCGDLHGQGHDGAPDPILVKPLKRQVHQPCVLRDPDPVLTPGSAAVTQLQIGQLSGRSAGLGVGGERGDPVSVDIALAQEHPELVCGMNLHLLQGVLEGLGQEGVRACLDPGPSRCCVRMETSDSR